MPGVEEKNSYCTRNTATMRKSAAKVKQFEIIGGRPLIILASGIIFFDTVGYGVVVPLLPMYTEKLGMNEFSAGILFASYALALLLFSIPLGLLADRTGRKPMVIFGMFGTVIATIIYAHSMNYPTLMTARVLDGITNAATWTAALSLVGDRFEEKEMGRMMGYIMAAMGAGGIAGPVLGGVLSDLAGYRSPFYFIAALCFVMGIYGCFLREDKTILAGSQVKLFEMISQVLKNRMVLVSCAAITFTTVGVGLIDLTFPLYLDQRFSVSRTQIGILFGMFMISHALASPVAGKLSDRFGEKRPLIAGILLTAAIAPLLGFASELYIIYLIMVVLGASFALFGTPILSVVVNAFKKDESNSVHGTRLGTAFSIINVSWSSGYAIGPLIGGAVMGLLSFTMVPIVYSAFLIVILIITIREL